MILREKTTTPPARLANLEVGHANMPIPSPNVPGADWKSAKCWIYPWSIDDPSIIYPDRAISHPFTDSFHWFLVKLVTRLFCLCHPLALPVCEICVLHWQRRQLHGLSHSIQKRGKNQTGHGTQPLLLRFGAWANVLPTPRAACTDCRPSWAHAFEKMLIQTLNFHDLFYMFFECLNFQPENSQWSSICHRVVHIDQQEMHARLCTHLCLWIAVFFREKNVFWRESLKLPTFGRETRVGREVFYAFGKQLCLVKRRWREDLGRLVR